MISFGLVMIWSLLMLLCMLRQKEIGGFIFLSLLIIPTIPIGGVRYSALYYWIIFYAVLIIINKCKLKISKITAYYIMLLVSLLLIYSVAWVINGKGVLFVSLIGYLKFIPLVVEVAILFESYTANTVEACFIWSIKVTLLLNLVVIIGQMINPIITTSIVENIFYNDDTINASDQIVKGTMSRCYGIFNHPAGIATFALIALAVFITKLKENKIKYVYILISLFVGFSSMSKTFILGLPLILGFYCFQNFVIVKNIKRTLIVVVSAVIIILLISNWGNIIKYISELNPYLGYYLSMLERPIDAFYTRYDISEGNLRQNYSIISEHYLIGVGPNAIGSESILDSAPIVIMHNGGILALGITVIMYIKIFLSALKAKNHVVESLILIVFFSGFGIPCWVFHNYTICIISYCLVILSKLSGHFQHLLKYRSNQHDYSN